MAKFPAHYEPRPYQVELHRMWRLKRIGVAVLPRQSGKDVGMSMEMCEARLKQPKTTGAYVSLDSPMIRDIVWQKTYEDPVERRHIQLLQDNVPAEYCNWVDTFMEGRFSNGSRMKFLGFFQSGRDKNGVGTSFQDYAFTELALFNREDPLPRLMPIIESESESRRLMVASTPRGKRENPLWKLIDSKKGDPDFQLIHWGINDLNEMMVREGLPPVLSEAALEKIEDGYFRRFGNRRMFEQEFHCSFEEMDAAAVYGEAYMKLVQDNRVSEFNLDSGHPVYVVFDIGSSGKHSDATSWIAFQWFNNKLFIYDCGEGHGRALPEYVDDLRQKHWFPRLAQIILPWDGEHHEKAINATPADMMRQQFANVAVLAKSNKVWKIPNSRSGNMDLITDIQQTRLQLYNTIINPQCQLVLSGLEQYKYKFNHSLQTWTEEPVHDKHSHMMDALRYAVQATKELDFFGGTFYGSGNKAESTSYVEDWTNVWAS